VNFGLRGWPGGGAAHVQDTSGTLLPNTVAGLIAWYAADRITGVANNAQFQTWSDLSGLANDLTQPTTGNRPRYLASSINGRPAVSFDGATSVINFPVAFSAGTNNTLFYVIQPSSASPAALLDSIPGQANIYRNTPAGSWEWWNASPVWLLGLSGAIPVSFCLTATLAPSRQVLYERNNTLISTNTHSSTTAMAWGSAVIGNTNGTAPWYSGTIGELAIYNRALTATERTQIAQYLASKWAIPLNS